MSWKSMLRRLDKLERSIGPKGPTIWDLICGVCNWADLSPDQQRLWDEMTANAPTRVTGDDDCPIEMVIRGGRHDHREDVDRPPGVGFTNARAPEVNRWKYQR